jgi:hypothetical protein
MSIPVGDAMVGLEEWKFPVEFYAIDGDNVCMGYTPPPDCDGCDGGEVCLGSEGFTSISLAFAPGGSEFVKERKK